MKETNKTECDYLIIGSGIAGLFAALKAADHGSVVVVTKRQADECNTKYAQGGIACVIAEGDSFEHHVRDTLEAGAGLCHEEVVREIVSQGPHSVEDLLDLGIEFTKSHNNGSDKGGSEKAEETDFDLGREGGHSRRRVLHAGDITGQELVDVLLKKCRNDSRIELLEDHIAIDLISTRKLCWQGENGCLGAYVLDRHTHSITTYVSRFTFLATGGAGKAYLYTSNPDVASGDGVAMAYRVYAEIRNMEFFQFHPTCLYHAAAKSFLISEAVRGEGAVLRIYKNGQYEEFMDKYHKMASLAPRDTVARAIDNELKKSGQSCVYLDITEKDEEFLRQRFPGIYSRCQELGYDMATDYLPVVPAAHYCCGGVKTDVNGHSTVANLYAIGETGCTGLHGANRLASNSLLEAMVVAEKAVRHSIDNPDPPNEAGIEEIPEWSSGNAVDSDEQIVISHNWDEIRRFMWDYVGIMRTSKRLERAKSRISMIRKEIEKYYWDFIVTPDLIELRNLASVAEMIIDSALARKESRGLHYNADYPLNNETPGKDTILRRPVKAEIWSE